MAANFKLLAYALILLRQGGQPCLFYGDLYGIRRNVETPMIPACNGKLPLLAQLRKHFAYGEQQDYFDEANCIGVCPSPTYPPPRVRHQPHYVSRADQTAKDSSAMAIADIPGWPA